MSCHVKTRWDPDASTHEGVVTIPGRCSKPHPGTRPAAFLQAVRAWGLPSAGEGASLSRFVQRFITSSDCGLRALRMTSSFSFAVIVLFFSGKGGCLARAEAISISSATAQPHTPSCCAVGESELKMNPWQSPQFRNRG